MWSRQSTETEPRCVTDMYHGLRAYNVIATEALYNLVGQARPLSLPPDYCFELHKNYIVKGKL